MATDLQNSGKSVDTSVHRIISLRGAVQTRTGAGCRVLDGVPMPDVIHLLRYASFAYSGYNTGCRRTIDYNDRRLSVHQ